MSLNAEQTYNAQQIMLAADSLGLNAVDTLKAKVIGIMTAITESGLHVYTAADEPSQEGTSLGLFQQIQAWGSVEVRQNPYQSALMFYKGGSQGQRGLLSVNGWQSMNPWNAAQAVQQSQFSSGSNYQATYQTAINYVQTLLRLPPGTPAPGPGSNPPISTTPTPTPGTGDGSPPITTIPGEAAPPRKVPNWGKDRPLNPLETAAGVLIPGIDPTHETVWAKAWDALSFFTGTLPRLANTLISPSFWLRVGAGIGAVILLSLSGYLIATSS